MRGKFGDGLPSSTLVLVRGIDTDIEIFSCGHRYEFFMKESGAGVNCMYFSTTHMSKTDSERHVDENDTLIAIKGLCNGEFDVSRYLFFQSSVERYSGETVEILKDDRHNHCVYVKGMRVQKDVSRGSIFFGMNLLVHDMKSRDRQNTLPPEVLQKNIISGWAEATEPEAESCEEACADLYVNATRHHIHG